ncbi:type II toxin-antitoxin system HicA family toxin [Ignavigranum ruoffiae]
MIKLLKKNGWTHTSNKGKGSHIIMKKPNHGSIIIPKSELKIGTERSILK